MTHAFPAGRQYTGFSAPSRMECDVFDLEVVQGDVPASLDGAFYRVQPDPVWPPKLGHDIPLNGDGMVTMFRIGGGHVDYRSRYVRTERFIAERAARRALFGMYRNPFTDDLSVKGKSGGTANTSVLWHSGRLMALKEDSRPIELDPETLETRGPVDFGGALTSPTFTAHPKVDPLTGELIGFGYEARGLASPDIAFYAIDATGQVAREEYLRAPYASMVHDFGVTREHVLFPISPLCSDAEAMRQGRPHFAWDGRKPCYLGVFPRRGSASDLRWFEGPTAFSSHTMNAFEEGDLIHYDTPVGNTVVFPFFPDVEGNDWQPARAAPRLERWTVDPRDKSGHFHRKKLSEHVVEFPRIDERFAMAPYRHGWAACDETPPGARPTSLGGGLSLNAIAHFDHAAGTVRLWHAGPGSAVQEPQFVPRSPDAPEGSGWLLVVVNRLELMHSDLVVLDALQLERGPVATLRLPMRLRAGLHGTWVDGADLSAAALAKTVAAASLRMVRNST
jgi:carotenoid cleavage dioxygenase-like enzyme